MRTRKSKAWAAKAACVAGFTLVELMIAMLLGLLVAGAATTIFMSNRQTYQATDNLGRIQENLRTSFELMARDVREAGGNPCANDLPIANVLNNPGGEWWSNFGTGLIGYEAGTAAQGLTTGTAEGQRVAGTDAIELKSAVDSNIRVVVKMPEPSADIEVSSTAGLDNNDIIMICDFNQASIMQVTQTPAGLKVQHNSGAGAPETAPSTWAFRWSAPMAPATVLTCMTRTPSSPHIRPCSGTSATTCAADAPYIAG